MAYKDTRRRHLRISTLLKTELFKVIGGEPLGNAFIADISLGGIGLNTSLNLEIGESYFFSFILPNGAPFPYMPGLIAQERKDTVSNFYGVKFEKIPLGVKFKFWKAINWLKRHPDALKEPGGLKGAGPTDVKDLRGAKGLFSRVDLAKHGTYDPVLAKEGRKFARAPLAVDLQMVHDGVPEFMLQSHIVDISEGGMQIACSKSFDVGTGFIVKFKLPNEAEEFAASGKIAWIKKYHHAYRLGLRFTQLKNDCRKGLRDYIKVGVA